MGKFHIAGTIPYLDPIFYEQFMKGKRNPTIRSQKSKMIDLYLADIYSLGVSLYTALIGSN